MIRYDKLIFCIINIYRIKYTELFDSIIMKIKTKYYTKDISFIHYYKLKESNLKNNIINYEFNYEFMKNMFVF